MGITHWIKPKKIIIDAYTSNRAIYELAQMHPASREKPNWWKHLPPSNHNPETGTHNTMKNCNGFNDLYARGFTIKTPCDFYLRKDQNGLSISQSAEMDLGGQHDSGQMGGNIFGENAFHFKLKSQWFIESSSNIDFLMTNHAWNLPQAAHNIFVPNGLINLSFLTELNVNMILNQSQENQVFEFNGLKPIAMLIPLTEKNIQIKHHLISPEELEKKKSGDLQALFFSNRRTKVKTELAKQKQIKKCPFGFGK